MYTLGNIASLLGFTGFSIFTVVCFLSFILVLFYLFMFFFFFSLQIVYIWCMKFGKTFKRLWAKYQIWKLWGKISLLVLMGVFTLSHKNRCWFQVLSVCAAIIRFQFGFSLVSYIIWCSRWAPKINFSPSPASHTEIHFFIGFFFPAQSSGYLIMQLLVFAPWNQLSYELSAMRPCAGCFYNDSFPGKIAAHLDSDS